MSAFKPTDSIPATAAISSLSELSPEIPTEPIIALFSSLIKTPPGTGIKLPSADGNLIPVPGGVLIRDENNAIIGSVGISGDSSDNDEIAAVAGIESVGLKADTG